jgi:dUTP pyrophosphatase
MLKKSITVTVGLLYSLLTKILHFVLYLVVPSFNNNVQEQQIQPPIKTQSTNTLLIKSDNDEIGELYKNHSSFHPGDSGYDLFVPEDVTFNLWETKFVNFQIKCEMINCAGNNVSYYLYPRSSISKTPLILHNSVGIIDSGYRGNIIAALKFVPEGSDNQTYTLTKGTRICQICSVDLSQLNHQLVNELSETKRGSGGFGSTGK